MDTVTLDSHCPPVFEAPAKSNELPASVLTSASRFFVGERWCIVNELRYVQDSVSSNEPVGCTKSPCFVYFCLSGMKKVCEAALEHQNELFKNSCSEI